MKNIKTVKELINMLNIKAKENSDNNPSKEFVSYEDALKALFICKNIKVETEGDALLFFSSINLLNTYVKQKDAKFKYFFKNNVLRIGNPSAPIIPNLKMEMQTSWGNALFIS